MESFPRDKSKTMYLVLALLGLGFACRNETRPLGSTIRGILLPSQTCPIDSAPLGTANGGICQGKSDELRLVHRCDCSDDGQRIISAVVSAAVLPAAGRHPRLLRRKDGLLLRLAWVLRVRKPSRHPVPSLSLPRRVCQQELVLGTR